MVTSEKKKAYVLVGLTGSQCDEFGWQLVALLVCSGEHWRTKMAVGVNIGRPQLPRWSPGLV